MKKCMRKCMYVYMYEKMYVCMYVWKNVCMYEKLYICMYVCMYVWENVCMYVSLYVWKNLYMYVIMYVWKNVCMYVCMKKMYVCKNRNCPAPKSHQTWLSSHFLVYYDTRMSSSAAYQCPYNNLRLDRSERPLSLFQFARHIPAQYSSVSYVLP